MQDNLKYGLFLMDENLDIQGTYSKALERILSISGLKGKNFINVLSSSLNREGTVGPQGLFRHDLHLNHQHPIPFSFLL
jgi:hypothetical protein